MADPGSPHEPSLRFLSDSEARDRLLQEGPNALPEPAEPGVPRLILRQLGDPLVVILLIAAAISLGPLDETASGLAILSVVALNTIVGTVQEWRAQRAMRGLRGLAAPTARVRRQEGARMIPAAELVTGDVVELMPGDRVPADLVLRVAHGLAIEEAILTGEAVPAEKVAGGVDERSVTLGDRRGEAFAGTLVVRGRAVGVVGATGPRTELGRIAKATLKSPPAPLELELHKVARVMAVVALSAGALLAIIMLLRAGSAGVVVYDAIMAGVALALAAIPEGLVAVVTSTLALGAQRMARRGAIVRQLRAIETLGSANVLCVDKTGTLTEGRLRVAAVSIPRGREAWFWETALRCNDAHDAVGDPIDLALQDEARAAAVRVELGPRIKEQPFDPVHRQMSTVHETPQGPVVSVKGAPEVVLARCRPDETLEAARADVEDASRRGLRVLAFARGPGSAVDAPDLSFCGLAFFSDPLRPSAIDAVRASRGAGIDVVLVTGDHVGTARAIGSAVGLDAERTVSGAQLAQSSPDQRLGLLASAAIVARVDPSIKVELVEARRRRGEVVAMMGDGVNDAPALRQADIGVAVAGAEGTDVAREAADIVLTRGAIDRVVDAIREGRTIYRNLVTVVAYLVSGNASEVFVTILGLFLFPELVVPLLPAQLLWINFVTDGLPGLALGVDRPAADPLAVPPRRRGEHLLGPRRLALNLARGAWLGAIVLSTAWLVRSGGASSEVVRTQVFLSLILAHLTLAFVVRSSRWTFETGWFRNRALAAAIAASALLQLLLVKVEALRLAFGLADVSWVHWALAGAGSIALVLGLDAGRAMHRGFSERTLLRGS